MKKKRILNTGMGSRFDEIGYWSEVKLEILKNYASAYSRILAAQTNPALSHMYIDAFAGAGVHLSKSTGQLVLGSPLNALHVRPPFREYYLIDTDARKVDGLKSMIGNRTDVRIFEGDCNEVLIEEVFPRVQYKQYRRGLCILDPYGLDLDWKVTKTAGQMKTLDVFLNFPVQDMNRNVLWRNPEKVEPAQIIRMNSYWGDESWKQCAYSTTGSLFGFPEKESNETIAEAFRKRLNVVAGFARVPPPLPMRNSKGAIVYYLYFASQKDTAEHIVLEIFEKFRNRGI
ncbi:MAG TPA: three-Cys-motif partner protein TcmP [Candidatus Acidoferrum sp.]|nr:three-Cys-motif partner protein TcmP [Candidatus Acidoferrum sp.]